MPQIKQHQGAFEYLYLEERGSSDTNEMKIVIQLSDSEEAPASAQLQFHYEGGFGVRNCGCKSDCRKEL